MIALLVVVLALVALPSSAVAAVTVTEFEVEPSSLQAGGHPSVTITQSFQYSSGTDDGKDTFVRLAPGLLGNPQNAAQCTSEQLRTTAGCPAAAKVGSVEATARPILAGLPGPMTLAVPGTVYNLRPKGGEPARLGLELQALGGLTKTYLEAPANLRPGPDGIGLETLFADQPRDAGLDIQIEGIALTFDAKASKGTFMRMPTSCAPAGSVARANSYEAPATFSEKTFSFTPSGCDKLGFSPSADGSLGAPGAIRRGSNPPLSTTLRFDPEQAALNRAEVTLPLSVAPDLAALPRVCTPGPAAPFCADSARVGTAIIDSPLQAEPVRGPVYFAFSTPAVLPGLLVYLPPPVDLRIDATVESTQTGVRNTFPANPDLPLRSFTLAIDGGSGGLLQLGQDLCAPKTPTAIGVKLTSHSGVVREFKQDLSTPGCDPLANVRVVKRGKFFTVAAVLRSARGGPAITSARLVLPKGLVSGKRSPRIHAGGRKIGAKTTRRALTVKPRGAGARRVKIVWRHLVAKRKLARRVTVRLKLTDSRKKTTSLRLRVPRD